MITSVGSIAIDHIIVVEKFSKNESVRILKFKEFFGGAGANVSVAVSRLGVKSKLVSVAGEDFNYEYRRYLKKEGVDLSNLVIGGKRCFRSFIISVPGIEEQEIYFYASSDLIEKFKKIELGNTGKIVHFSTWEDFEVYERLMKEAKENSLISFDPGQQTHKDPEGVCKLLKFTDFLFMNEYEAKTISNYLKKPIWEIKGPKIIWISLGKEGAKFYYKGEEIYIPSVKPEKEIDPTGCGDSHRAGFLVAYLKGCDIETAGRIGAVVASFVIEKEGSQTNLPTWEEVEKRYRKVFGEGI